MVSAQTLLLNTEGVVKNKIPSVQAEQRKNIKAQNSLNEFHCLATAKQVYF